ncbi:MAG TPA: hypothetical protein VFJ02_11025 [Vicinamibacterales bacterium]|nr:hypothetical protein [Vicinamibacterales bacterium]
MIRILARAAATAVLGALAGSAWLALAYGTSSGLRIDFDVTPPKTIVRGAYPAERDPNTGRTFAWTGESLTIDLADIDRQVDWALEMQVRGARAGGQPNPALDLFVDGVLAATRPTTVDYETIVLPIAQRPAQSGVSIVVRPSSTFVPGPGDRRALGVMIDWLSIAPVETVLPPGTAFTGVAIASALAGFAFALLGVTAGAAIGAVILLSAALAALVAHGFGPYTDYPGVVMRATAWIGVAAAGLTMAASAVRGQPFRKTARFAIAFTAAVCLAELLVLLHPDMPIGDALFHAHRFQDVMGGRFYFTSIAPGNYHFPYAPGLYVAAMPFAALVKRGDADMTLLRTIVCAADALAGLLIYNMAIRVRGDRLAGALGVALYHLLPLGFGVVAVGNLTNAFAQSLSVAAFAVMASPRLRIENRATVGTLTLALAAASLAHTSAFAIVSTAAIVIALMFWWRGGPALRSPAGAIMIAATASIVLAVAIYYAHFIDTYRNELSRIGAETATAAPDAGGRGIGERLVSVPRYLQIYLGIPALVLAAWGGARLWQRGARDRVTLSASGWLLTCLLFLVLGILTPVDMRYYLAAIPAIAVIAAIGASVAWSAGGEQRIVAAILLAWTIAGAVRFWWSTLG